MNKTLLGMLIFCLVMMILPVLFNGADSLLSPPRHYDNDIMDFISQIAPLIFFGAIICAIFFIPIFISASKNEKKHLGEGSTDPLEQKIVTVIRKRNHSPQGMMTNLHLILFQDEEGTRVELALKDEHEFNLIVQGDKGVLTHRGKQFISFERNTENDK